MTITTKLGKLKAQNDEDDSNEEEKSPWEKAGLFGKFSLWFIGPLMWKSRSKLLTSDDLGQLPKVDKSNVLGNRLARHYDYELKAYPRPSLLRALIKTFGWHLFFVGLWDLVSKWLGYPLQIISAGWLARDAAEYLTLISNGEEINQQLIEETYRKCLMDTAILLGSTALATFSSHPFLFQSYHIGMKCRIAACHLIYNKTLRLSQSALAQTSTGKMVNLLSNDVNRFDQVAHFFTYLFSAPIQSISSMAILSVYYIGPIATLACASMVLICAIMHSFMGKKFSRFRLQTASETDERVRLMSELIESIRIVKMYGWEKPFEMLVAKSRKRELDKIKKISILKAINVTLSYLYTKIIVFVTLAIFVQTGGRLTLEIVLVVNGLSNLVRVMMTIGFANAIAQCAEALISCRRIDDYMMLPEIEQLDYKHPTKIGLNSSKPSINLSIKEATASWNQADLQSSPILRQLTMLIEPNELVLVVGRVGSGKSSLLMAILGELPLSSGEIECAGQKLSYSAQEAWIFSGSIRDNILFNRPFIPERYRQILKACCLERDLELLIEGDKTQVGERGVSLSGGQKARVNLARALYQEADIYLLDDPLSAVDAPVARQLFSGALKGFLAGKCVILATHQLQFLQEADKILIMSRESTPVFGTMAEVSKSELFQQLGLAAVSNPTDDHKPEAAAQSETKRTETKVKKGEQSNQRLGAEVVNDVSSSSSTYIYYIGHACGLIGFVLFAFNNLVAHSLMLSIEAFINYWADTMQRREQIDFNNLQTQTILDKLDSKELIICYGLLIALTLLAYFLVVFTFYLGTLRASQKIHDKLFSGVIRARMSFFDFTSIGVILNRFSRDLGFMDQIFPPTAIEIITMLTNILCVTILSVLLNYLNILPSIILIVSALSLRSFCIGMITRLKQIEGVTRSPVFSHLSTTLSGLATVRSIDGADQMFARKFDHFHDEHSKVWFIFLATGRWISCIMDWLCLAFIVLVLSLLMTMYLDAVDASCIGLLVSQIIFMPGPFQHAMRQLAEVESQMTSVERIREFCDLPGEPGNDNQQVKVQENVEKGESYQGRVEFREVTMIYLPGEPAVLKHLSFSIEAGEKIGIVGRTGAGKSSILAALFRLYDFTGTIKLDGIDIKLMDLKELRRKISIIPQSPVLFAGTIRRNLDPFEEYNDTQLWSALKAVQLGDIIAKSPDKLECLVNEGGCNFSVGQRQLICLARAILRRNKILVLDEATANVDPETDAFIQRTIKQEFSQCTVLTIAHRLITIIDSDRVMVMSGGQLSEFASPRELLRDETSLFSQMVASSSSQLKEQVKELIKKR